MQLEDLALDKRIIKSFKSKPILSPEMFQGEVMHPKVRAQLLKIAKEFIQSLDIEVNIEDVTLTGSLANYNWSDFSDIDLHILIDFNKLGRDKTLLKQYFDAKKNLWNETHNILVQGFETEVYIQDTTEKHTSTGVYSVLRNRWVVTPEKNSKAIDKIGILEKSRYYAKLIDKLVRQAQGGRDVRAEIDALQGRLKNFRQAGLDSGGEYSTENLTFKLLRRNGHIEKLFSLKRQLQDKDLSSL